MRDSVNASLDIKAAGSVCAAWPHAGSVQSLTFASCERGDLSGSGSDVVDDGILEPGNP